MDDSYKTDGIPRELKRMPWMVLTAKQMLRKGTMPSSNKCKGAVNHQTRRKGHTNHVEGISILVKKVKEHMYWFITMWCVSRP
jgi:hypothetical protein